MNADSMSKHATMHGNRRVSSWNQGLRNTKMCSSKPRFPFDTPLQLPLPVTRNGFVPPPCPREGGRDCLLSVLQSGHNG
eukprot:6139016-Pyramimonas_sp.AAC.3